MAEVSNGLPVAEATEPTEFELAQMVHWAEVEAKLERMATAFEAIAEVASRAKKSRWLR